MPFQNAQFGQTVQTLLNLGSGSDKSSENNVASIMQLLNSNSHPNWTRGPSSG